jgi:hypothetical protein
MSEVLTGSSYAGLTRVSIYSKRALIERWIAGSSPAMTIWENLTFPAA